METETTFELSDEFNRKPIAEKLIRLLTSEIDISPMSIDGGWGTGKTAFCKKLIALLKERYSEYQLVYVDAFRSDHSGEPLLALLAQIIKDCTPEDKNGKQSEERKRLIKILANATGFVFKTVAKAAAGNILKQNIEILTQEFQNNVINNSKKDNITDSISITATKISDQAIDSTIEMLLEEQIEAEKNLELLKETLSAFAADKKIILFIDELDRCRPDYAIEMLELIKHIFDISNVKVVLVTNIQQLHASINHRYGDGINAQKYLNKFLKFNFKLSEFVRKGLDTRNQLASLDYFYNLSINSNILKNINAINIDYRIKFIATLIEKNNLSLREIETFIRNLEIFYTLKFIKRSSLGHQLLEILGVFIFCFYPKLTDSILKNNVDAHEISNLFGLSKAGAIPTENEYIKIILSRLIESSQIHSSNYHLDTNENDFINNEKDLYGNDINYYNVNIFIILKEVLLCLQLTEDISELAI